MSSRGQAARTAPLRCFASTICSPSWASCWPPAGARARLPPARPLRAAPGRLQLAGRRQAPARARRLRPHARCAGRALRGARALRRALCASLDAVASAIAASVPEGADCRGSCRRSSSLPTTIRAARIRRRSWPTHRGLERSRRSRPREPRPGDGIAAPWPRPPRSMWCWSPARATRITSWPGRSGAPSAILAQGARGSCARGARRESVRSRSFPPVCARAPEAAPMPPGLPIVADRFAQGQRTGECCSLALPGEGARRRPRFCRRRRRRPVPPVES